jgi:hypothetical protein
MNQKPSEAAAEFDRNLAGMRAAIIALDRLRRSAAVLRKVARRTDWAAQTGAHCRPEGT